MQQGPKNQLSKYFENVEKKLMLGEEEGNKMRTKTNYQVRRAD